MEVGNARAERELLRASSCSKAGAFSSRCTPFPAFADKIGSLFLGVKPDKLAKIIEIDLDVLLSVPPEKVTAFNGVVKDAFDGLKPDGGCDLVPLPPPSLVERFTSSELMMKRKTSSIISSSLWASTGSSSSSFTMFA